jgi:TM2 domain-containing membrane protein YozV
MDHDSAEPTQMSVLCPHCSATLTVPASKAGETVSCQGCEGRFQVPLPTATSPYSQPLSNAASNFQSSNGNLSGSAAGPPEYQRFVALKFPAALTAILLGGLGVHKFILGFPIAGGLMLGINLLCIITGICFFVPWLGSLVVLTISVIEGILYLTKSDQQFYQDYAINKREWF